MEELIYEYDNVLIGHFPSISLECFNGVEPGGYNEKLALGCIKYAMEKIMGWDEEIACQRLDEYMITQLKLTPLLRFIEFPPYITEGDPRYILHRIYPNRVKINQEDLTITAFLDVLEERRSQYPRDFFLGLDGFHRFCFILKYILEHYEIFNNIEDVYNYFSSPKGNIFLSKYKLKIPTYQYKVDVIKAIYTITKNSPDGELYYNYYLFNKEFNSFKKGI